MRLALAVAVSLVVAVGVALVRGGDFRQSLAIACALVACVCLLLAPAGQSPAMRMGTVDSWTASRFPKLIPGMADYGSTTLSAPALFILTAAGLFALALLLGL